MRDIINELIDIENKAREITDEAEQERVRLPKRIKDAHIKIDAEINADTDEKLARIKERVGAQADEDLKRINAQTEEKLARIEYEFSERRVKLEDDIFNRIIGR